jgi:D-xylose transport system permease protein
MTGVRLTLRDGRRSERGALGPGAGSRLIEALGGELRVLPVIAALVVIWVVFYAANPVFLSPRNLSELSLQIVVTGVVALGVVFVLLVGEIDLSAASSSGVCAAVMATLYVNYQWSAGWAVAVAILVGMGIGLIQVLVVVFGAPSFVVTLGGGLILQGGLLFLLPDAGQINLAGTSIGRIADSSIASPWDWLIAALASVGYAAMRATSYRSSRRRGMRVDALRSLLLPAGATTAGVFLVTWELNRYRGIPVAVAIFLGLLALSAYATTQTRYGAHLYATGGNRNAARRTGIRIGYLVISTFVISGACAAIAGIIAASRVLGVSSYSGSGSLMLEAIAAAVIGGTSLFGGRGTVWAAVLGALIIGSISNGMDILGLQPQVKLVTEGSILVAAVALDSVIARGSLWPKP